MLRDFSKISFKESKVKSLSKKRIKGNFESKFSTININHYHRCAKRVPIGILRTRIRNYYVRKITQFQNAVLVGFCHFVEIFQIFSKQFASPYISNFGIIPCQIFRIFEIASQEHNGGIECKICVSS